MEQLTFELAAAEPPSFGNFLAGRNAEAVAQLEQAALGRVWETGIVVWGAAGSGRTHLLRAAVAAAAVRRPATYWSGPGAVTSVAPEPGAWVAIDDVETADPQAQGRLFTLFNHLQQTGGQMLAAAAMPPARLPLRDDLRTRLGWGLVYELLPLADADKPQALVRYAQERGFRLGDDVIGYLLSHGRRDMTTLMTTLAALDRYSLASKRPITLPLLREWLQRGLPLDP